MTQQDILVRVLRPDQGHYLTQADPATPDEDRVIADEVTLGETDSPDNWAEITAAQAAELQIRLLAAAKARAKQNQH